MSAPGAEVRRSGPLARLWGFLVFLLVFLRALVMANVQLVVAVLFRRREDLNPGFLTYPVSGLSRFEILVLTHCITLTPGTTSVKLSSDFGTLLIHALDVSAPKATRDEIRAELEAPILRWTR